MMPLISIIIPVYNTEKYIRRCIDSVIAQSYSDWELILVDDGSTDESGKICDEYVEKDERIRVFHKENGGVSSARNVGLDNANGEWVTFVDSDDYLQNDALEVLLGHLSAGTDLIIGGYKILDECGEVIYVVDDNVNGVISRKTAIEWMYQPKHLRYFGYICSKLYKRRIIEEEHLRFCEGLFFNEDRLFAIEYLSKINGNVNFFTCPIYNILERENSAMSSLQNGYNKKFVTDFDAFVLMKKVIKTLPEAEQLIPLADKGIKKSYDWNHAMMCKFNDYSAHNHWHMICGLIKTGVFVDYLKELLVPLAMFLCPKYFCRER